jgi:hypothetical protein
VTEPSEFAYYHARLMRADDPVIGTFPRLLWRKPVFLRMDTGYNGQTLVRRYGDRWPAVLAKATADKNFDILGSDDGRSWFTISTWRPTFAMERVEPVPVSGHREMTRERMRLTMGRLDKEPSRAAAAHHLKRQGLTRPQIVKTMNELGWNDVSSLNIGDHLKYGREQEKRGDHCPFDATP